MIVSYTEIRSRIRKLWPKCRNIWLTDSEYEYPVDVGLLNTIIRKDHTERLKFRQYTLDCDDFALQLAAAVSKDVGQKPEFAAPWPFGIVMARKFNHKKEKHVCNICLLENAVLIVEPQTDQIFPSSGENDDPFFILI